MFFGWLFQVVGVSLCVVALLLVFGAIVSIYFVTSYFESWQDMMANIGIWLAKAGVIAFLAGTLLRTVGKYGKK
jgi:hypothetical protein